jgi:uncharacterized protein
MRFLELGLTLDRVQRILPVSGTCTAMKTREDIVEALSTLKPIIQQRYKLRSMALFGSYARNEQTEQSDVDVLVDVDPSLGLDFIDLADCIEERLGIRTDVVPASGVKPRYQEIIRKDLIYV